MRHAASIGIGLALILSYHAPVWACATCFGAKDDPQTQGMNMAILTLMGVTYTLFLGMIGTAVVVWRKNRKAAHDPPEDADPNPADHAYDAEIHHG